MAKHRFNRTASAVSKAKDSALRLPPKAASCLADLRAALAAGDIRTANAHWCLLSILAPEHPLMWRGKGEVMWASGDVASAADAWSKALTLSPSDTALRVQLARALGAANRDDDARDLLCDIPDTATAQDWLDVSIELDRQGRTSEALLATDCALQASSSLLQAKLLRARCLQITGNPAGAASEYRQIIVGDSRNSGAWFGLIDLKTETISPDELIALRDAHAAEANIEAKMLLAFALAKAEESAGNLEQAIKVLRAGNQMARPLRLWDGRHFCSEIDAIIDAFGEPQEKDVHGRNASTQNVDVIFVTGLPRSGSTLVEHVLAAHPDVSGGGEIPVLPSVIAAESQRRGQPFPRWATTASEGDWQRLGARYLQGVERRRGSRRVITDKLPSNWLYAGAVLKMLPHARFVHCVRDPVETLWSCYQQLFAPGGADFAFDFDDLALYWTGSQKLTRHWQRSHPERFYRLDYEQLVEKPDSEIRALLAACGLPFDDACLQPHKSARHVHTPSASQVRQPIRSNTARTHRYGRLLDDLRLAIKRHANNGSA